MDLYDITIKDAAGRDVSMAAFKGKVLLIVNTATACGFTPQYGGLQKLYEQYHERGLEILDFPCNQFGQQAPGSQEEIASFCQGRFGITFPQFQKIDVNGEHEAPLYSYLKSQQGGLFGAEIKWNFTKFLIDREGHIVARWGSPKKPKNIAPEIEKLL